ncbi:MAG: hypothetical protein F6K42_19685 [Leptolyngbya sp. SIO1D8]|nr:hypothetical protein [Leptolyngbya sp. SIO1D8]
MNIREIQRKADEFKEYLKAVKQDSPDIDWYFGDILGNMGALAGTLKGEDQEIFGKFAGGTIADIGAADGDIAFFFERLGYQCDIIDFPDYNFNRLQGAYQLQESLKSQVSIYEIDLDQRFELPKCYDAVIFLGILYHLKNPFFTLEILAQQARYCFLSSRIARWLVSGRWPWQRRGYIRNSPVAYLLAPDECNNDSTNYWIFSEAGLRQIVERAGWEICDLVSYGDIETSNPRDQDRDERAFMFLKSRFF